MRTIIILAQSEFTADVLSTTVRLVDTKSDVAEKHRHVVASGSLAGAGLISVFREEHSFLEQTIARDRAGVIVLVDAVDLENLSPIHSDAWSVLVAMLVLAFPEIRWVFGFCPEAHGDYSGDPESVRIRRCHAWEQLWMPHPDPLFDATGLRAWIARRSSGSAQQATQLGSATIPVRQHVAVVIDEEPHYAYLFGYMAYRFGHRTWVLDSAELLATFARQAEPVAASAPDPNPAWLSRPPDLLIEDLFLNFPDRLGLERDSELSNLHHRAEWYPFFTRARRRVLVTVGHRRGRARESYEANRDYIQREGIQVEYKPVAGIFDVWQRIRVWSRLRRSGKEKTTLQRWPQGGSQAPDDDLGHSAHGRLLVVAACLISRAEAILTEVRSVEDAVHGAVLAGDALTLLGSRTPTSALEALVLKHQFEVLAECQFYGVEYNFNIENRFREIRKEIRDISRWFNPAIAKRVMYNSELAIISKLRGVFRDNDRFEDVKACSSRIRHLHRHLWVRKHLPWSLPAWPVRWYVEFLLDSPVRFALFIVLWAVGIASVFALQAPDPTHSLAFGFASTLQTFFGGGAINGAEQNWGLVITCIFAVLLGFMHLGVFISLLFSWISRE